MSPARFILRSLRFHWRNHLGVVLGATLATTILVGALAVGDSVRHSLERQALLRLGQIHFAVNSHDRFFRAQLAEELAANLQAPVAPVVAMSGLFSTADGRKRVNHLQVFGGDDRFWALGDPPKTRPSASSWIPGGTAWGNPEFARRVQLEEGTAASSPAIPPNGIVRLEKPTWLPRDAPIAPGNESSSAMRITLTTGSETLNRFSLQANQSVPPTVVVALPWLQQEIEKPGCANVLLIGQNAMGTLTVDQVNAAIRKVWALADADLELVEVQAAGRATLELRTDRVFLESPIIDAAVSATPPTGQLLTYFVNELRRGDRTLPYSFVTASNPGAIDLLRDDPTPLRDDEIVINDWVAEDLQANVGDTLALKYFVVGPGRGLEERQSVFRVRAIIPVATADGSLTPRIPGLSDKENCRDWDPGTTIHLDRIRPKDEAYWEKYHGTPKAFVSLNAGEKMWSNRFGDRTALRWLVAPVAGSEKAPNRNELAEKIRGAIDPAKVGLFAQPIREQALKAARESHDFGGLFIGLSFFLVVAALLLMGLLFAFSVDQRSQEIGTLLAVGWTSRAVRRLFLFEGLALAVVGGVIGTGAGLAYTKVVLWALMTQWRDAIAGAELWFHAEPATLATGATASALIAWAVIWLVMRRAARLPARALLSGQPALAENVGTASGGSWWSGLTPSRFRRAPVESISPAPNPAAWGQAAPPPVLSRLSSALKSGLLAIIAAAVAAVFLGRGFLGEHSAADFFGAGAMLLIAGLAACRAIIATIADRGLRTRSTATLALQNVARRRGRSLTTIGLLACGSFLVIAVGANRHDTAAGAGQRSSGTGGFTHFGETTLPLHQDLNTPAGRETFGLPKAGFENLRVVPLRMREGDDASCLNLNRAQAPRLLGVDPRELADRGAFTFLDSAASGAGNNPWLLLDAREGDGPVPAIGDEATVRWALGKKVGDTIPYTDGRGRTFSLRIVGMIANSILQGSLVIAEKNFVTQFPSESGQRVFLVDAPPPKAKELAGALTQALRDYGLELQPAAERLALFQQVENTYLTIFQALGGLGLLLGSVGLGVVVLRNALERRSELALLRAVGFTRRRLRSLILIEHTGLLLLGLACGIVAAIVAVLPTLRASVSQVPYQSLGLTMAALLASGVIWIWLASAVALRGPLLQALRSE